jgi:hypothetical protein
MRRVVRWVQNPVVSGIALVVIIVEAAMLPDYPSFSGAGQWLRYRAPTPWQMAIPTDIGWLARSNIAELWAVQNADGWRLIDPEIESWDELGAILESGSDPVVYARPGVVHRRSGLWAITHNATGSSIQLDGAPLTHEDELAIRSLVVDHLPDGSLAPSLRIADAVTTRIVWSGVVHDVVTLTALMVLILSLGWVPRAPAWIRSTRASRALSRGQCPSCGYAIAGLDACPECGRAIDSTHPAPTTSV